MSRGDGPLGRHRQALALIGLLIVMTGCGGLAERQSEGSIAGAAVTGTDPSGGNTGNAGGQASTGGMGGAGGQVGNTDAGSEPELQRVFLVSNSIGFPPPPQQCLTSDDCDGRRCFKMTEQVGFCEELFLEATSCNVADPNGFGPADECGCGGLSCGTGEICRAVKFMCSCAPHVSNTCIEMPCEAPSDCGPGTVCIPSQFVFGERCLDSSGCDSDADCTLGDRGRCGLQVVYPQQQGEIWLSGTFCAYEPVGIDPPVCGENARAVSGGGAGLYTCP